MAVPSSRDALITYCKRALGWPVIDINVDDDQVSDRVDEALQFFQAYHFDSIQKVYLKYLMTQTDVNNQYVDMTRASGQVSTTSGSNVVTGVGTNFTGEFTPGTSRIQVGSENYIVSAVTSATSLTTDTNFTTTNNGVTFKNPLATDFIAGVTRIFPISSSNSTVNMFDLRYQLRLHELYDFTSTSYINYVLTMQHLRTLDMLFSGEIPVRFNRHQNRLYVDMDWQKDINVGEYLVIECYRLIDPDQYTAVYNDRWLKKYTTSLIKRQWGTNMKKFGGIQLPGGVTLQGQQIYEEAVAEINEIEDRIQSMYEEPPQFILG